MFDKAEICATASDTFEKSDVEEAVNRFTSGWNHTFHVQNQIRDSECKVTDLIGGEA